MQKKPTNFTYQQAENFVTQLIDDIFHNCNTNLLKKYYTTNVIGHFRNEIFHLNDISQRVFALKNSTEKRHFILEDLAIINDLIVFRTRQNWVNAKDQSFSESIVFGVYRIKNHKITELWLLLDAEAHSYKDINLNFSEKMRLFELNQKEKNDFFRRLSPIIKLSNTEKECLYYYFHGFSAKETANKMKISFRTVQTYIANVKDRLNCKTKLELQKQLFSTSK